MVLKPCVLNSRGGRSQGAQMPRPRDREPEQMPLGCPGGGGGGDGYRRN